MKKYNKPTIQVVELSVKESLSALPASFNKAGIKMGTLGSATYKNLSIYRKNSAPAVQG